MLVSMDFSHVRVTVDPDDLDHIYLDMTIRADRNAEWSGVVMQLHPDESLEWDTFSTLRSWWQRLFRR